MTVPARCTLPPDGTAAALVAYAIVIGAAATAIWRRPVLALYPFVVGLAVHNAVMAAFYGAGLRGAALTAVTAWKEILLGVALRDFIDALRDAPAPVSPRRRRRRRARLRHARRALRGDPAERARRRGRAQGCRARGESRHRPGWRMVPRPLPEARRRRAAPARMDAARDGRGGRDDRPRRRLRRLDLLVAVESPSSTTSTSTSATTTTGPAACRRTSSTTSAATSRSCGDSSRRF